MQSLCLNFLSAWMKALSSLLSVSGFLLSQDKQWICHQSAGVGVKNSLVFKKMCFTFSYVYVLSWSVFRRPAEERGSLQNVIRFSKSTRGVSLHGLTTGGFLHLLLLHKL